MRYVSGIHALNVHEPDDRSCGDWHAAAASEVAPTLLDSDFSVMGEEGLRDASVAPWGEGTRVACHERAVVELAASGDKSIAGFSDDWLCSKESDRLAMRYALMFEGTPMWDNVDAAFMNEYGSLWLMAKGEL